MHQPFIVFISPATPALSINRNWAILEASAGSQICILWPNNVQHFHCLSINIWSWIALQYKSIKHETPLAGILFQSFTGKTFHNVFFFFTVHISIWLTFFFSVPKLKTIILHGSRLFELEQNDLLYRVHRIYNDLSAIECTCDQYDVHSTTEAWKLHRISWKLQSIRVVEWIYLQYMCKPPVCIHEGAQRVAQEREVKAGAHIRVHLKFMVCLDQTFRHLYLPGCVDNDKPGPITSKDTCNKL